MTNSWFKCFPSDFLNGVSDLTPHELSVYTILMMRMYDEDGPVKDDPKRISRRCNMRTPTCEKALDSLCETGKLHRKDGLIFNGRAQNEIKKRREMCAKQTSNAQERWNKDTKKPNENNVDAMPPHSQTDAKPMPTRYKKLELDKKKKILKEKEFDLFWKVYPRRKETPTIVGKKACQGKLSIILTSGEATLEEVVSGAAIYAKSDTVRDGFVRLPMTWLNQAGWEDEQTPAKPKPVDEWTLDAWRKRLGPVGKYGAIDARNNWGQITGGNFPYKCPPEILSEYWPDEEIAA